MSDFIQRFCSGNLKTGTVHKSIDNSELERLYITLDSGDLHLRFAATVLALFVRLPCWLQPQFLPRKIKLGMECKGKKYSISFLLIDKVDWYNTQIKLIYWPKKNKSGLALLNTVIKSEPSRDK